MLYIGTETAIYSIDDEGTVKIVPNQIVEETD